MCPINIQPSHIIQINTTSTTHKPPQSYHIAIGLTRRLYYLFVCLTPLAACWVFCLYIDILSPSLAMVNFTHRIICMMRDACEMRSTLCLTGCLCLFFSTSPRQCAWARNHITTDRSMAIVDNNRINVFGPVCTFCLV